MPPLPRRAPLQRCNDQLGLQRLLYASSFFPFISSGKRSIIRCCLHTWGPLHLWLVVLSFHHVLPALALGRHAPQVHPGRALSGVVHGRHHSALVVPYPSPVSVPDLSHRCNPANARQIEPLNITSPCITTCYSMPCKHQMAQQAWPLHYSMKISGKSALTGTRYRRSSATAAAILW